jgi:hypothetical protein
MAEREGFEPSVPLLSSTRDFQSRSFGQLGHLSADLGCLCLSLVVIPKVAFPALCDPYPGRIRKDEKTRTATERRPLNLLRGVPDFRMASAQCDLPGRFHEIKTQRQGGHGGEGGIRTHVPRYSRGKSISSRPRYGHFGTSPFCSHSAVFLRSLKKRTNRSRHSSSRTPETTLTW